MDPVSGVAPSEFNTRDLRTFNRWLCISRLRAAMAVVAFAAVMRWLTPGTIALRPVVAICAGLIVVSLLGLASRRATGTRWFFVLQTFADLAAVTLGLGSAVSGLPALLMRPLFAVIVVPASLISVPTGLFVAAAATAGHVALLITEHGIQGTSFGSVECLAPPFLFFLIAQQSFFYGAHLERKNKALAALADEVRAASVLKSEFVGAVSHELRSPLNVMLGYLEMALDRAFGPLTAELESALRSTQHQSLALLEMITALLDLNRFESGRVPLERAPVAIGALLTEIAEHVPESWRRPGVVLRVTATEPLPIVETDRGKLKTVLRNLVHNALKFTDRGEVRVGAHVTAAGDVAITVEDTGCGIPEEALGYIFDMFRQVPGSGGAGVGLGLHIVRRLLDAVGGAIVVTSDIGVGTCFTVTLPVHAEVRHRRFPVPRAA